MSLQSSGKLAKMRRDYLDGTSGTMDHHIKREPSTYHSQPSCRWRRTPSYAHWEHLLLRPALPSSRSLAGCSRPRHMPCHLRCWSQSCWSAALAGWSSVRRLHFCGLSWRSTPWLNQLLRRFCRTALPSSLFVSGQRCPVSGKEQWVNPSLIYLLWFSFEPYLYYKSYIRHNKIWA